MDSLSNQLKKAERNVDDLESQFASSTGASFATPQKRESGVNFRHPNSAAKSNNRNAFDNSNDSNGDVDQRLAEAERKLEEKDGVIRDLETKLFENSVISLKN